MITDTTHSAAGQIQKIGNSVTHFLKLYVALSLCRISNLVYLCLTSCVLFLICCTCVSGPLLDLCGMWLGGLMLDVYWTHGLGRGRGGWNLLTAIVCSLA